MIMNDGPRPDLWAVAGIADGDEAYGIVYSTETLAYAALGRLVARSGYLDSDWHVIGIRLQSAPPDEVVPVPAALPAEDRLPRPWSVERADDDETVMILARNGRAVVRVCIGGLSKTEDVALAEHLAVLVNADVTR